MIRSSALELDTEAGSVTGSDVTGGLGEAALISLARFLGAAFLLVILTSLAGGALLAAAVGSGSPSEMLSQAAARESLLRASAVAELATSVGIVAMATLLYLVLGPFGRVGALFALGLWLLEATFIAFRTIGTLALVPVSHDFAASAAADATAVSALGGFLYRDLVQGAYTVHMLFYCAGGLVWYSMFYRSRLVPRPLSLFGVAAACLGLLGIVADLAGAAVPIVVYLPILPFELAIGAWLLFKGVTIRHEPTPTPATGRPAAALP
jgi:hypothetical protein